MRVQSTEKTGVVAQPGRLRPRGGASPQQQQPSALAQRAYSMQELRRGLTNQQQSDRAETSAGAMSPQHHHTSSHAGGAGQDEPCCSHQCWQQLCRLWRLQDEPGTPSRWGDANGNPSLPAKRAVAQSAGACTRAPSSRARCSPAATCAGARTWRARPTSRQCRPWRCAPGLAWRTSSCRNATSSSGACSPRRVLWGEGVGEYGIPLEEGAMIFSSSLANRFAPQWTEQSHNRARGQEGERCTAGQWGLAAPPPARRRKAPARHVLVPSTCAATAARFRTRRRSRLHVRELGSSSPRRPRAAAPAQHAAAAHPARRRRRAPRPGHPRRSRRHRSGRRSTAAHSRRHAGGGCRRRRGGQGGAAAPPHAERQ